MRTKASIVIHVLFIFSQASVSHSVHGGCLTDTPLDRHTPTLGRHPPAQSMLGYSPPCPVHAGIHIPCPVYILGYIPPAATATDGTHPNWMHSCFLMLIPNLTEFSFGIVFALSLNFCHLCNVLIVSKFRSTSGIPHPVKASNSENSVTAFSWKESGLELMQWERLQDLLRVRSDRTLDSSAPHYHSISPNNPGTPGCNTMLNRNWLSNQNPITTPVIQSLFHVLFKFIVILMEWEITAPRQHAFITATISGWSSVAHTHVRCCDNIRVMEHCPHAC